MASKAGQALASVSRHPASMCTSRGHSALQAPDMASNKIPAGARCACSRQIRTHLGTLLCSAHAPPSRRRQCPWAPPQPGGPSLQRGWPPLRAPCRAWQRACCAWQGPPHQALHAPSPVRCHRGRVVTVRSCKVALEAAAHAATNTLSSCQKSRWHTASYAQLRSAIALHSPKVQLLEWLAASQHLMTDRLKSRRLHLRLQREQLSAQPPRPSPRPAPGLQLCCLPTEWP